MPIYNRSNSQILIKIHSSDRLRIAQMLFKESVHVQDVLLQVALGHSLIGSQSCLAALSKDIIQHALATAIEEAYWESRSQEGLLTPKPVARRSKFCPELPEMAELPDQAIRRAVVRPLSTSPLLFRTNHSSWFASSNSDGRDMLRMPAPSPCSSRKQPPRHSLTRKSPRY